MFWVAFIGGLLLILLAALCYLVRGVCKFHFVSELSHGKKWEGRVIGAAVVLLPCAVIWAVWGYMNMIIVMLHLAIGWGMAEAVQCGVQKLRGRPFRRYYAGLFAVMLTACYLGIGYYQANHVWQTDYTLTTEKNVGTLRIALLADSHVGTTFDGEELAEHVARIQEQSPDVVVIAGDLVDESTSEEDMIAACRSLGQFDAPYGVYFIFGNHDKGWYTDGSRGYDGDDVIRELEKNGITILQDESVLIDGRFYLVGRQDASEEKKSWAGRAPICELTQHLEKDVYTIVLDHQPNDYDAEAASQVDLVLSGHTHGGQLIPLMQFIKWFHIANDNVYGLEKRDNTDFIVTSGISDWALQFKTGCRSEYVIIDIQGTGD